MYSQCVFIAVVVGFHFSQEVQNLYCIAYILKKKINKKNQRNDFVVIYVLAV